MEMLFVVTRQDGREVEFLKHWETIALYCELNGFYNAEGYAIGLAAAKAGLTVRWDEMSGLIYFKDWIEKQKIKKGEVNHEKALICFQQHEAIEYRQKTIVKKLQEKLKQLIIYYRVLLYLRFIAIENFHFYYK